MFVCDRQAIDGKMQKLDADIGGLRPLLYSGRGRLQESKHLGWRADKSPRTRSGDDPSSLAPLDIDAQGRGTQKGGPSLPIRTARSARHTSMTGCEWSSAAPTPGLGVGHQVSLLIMAIFCRLLPEGWMPGAGFLIFFLAG
jgi:hypothetical protein